MSCGVTAHIYCLFSWLFPFPACCFSIWPNWRAWYQNSFSCCLCPVKSWSHTLVYPVWRRVLLYYVGWCAVPLLHLAVWGFGIGVVVGVEIEGFWWRSFVFDHLAVILGNTIYENTKRRKLLVYLAVDFKYCTVIMQQINLM